MTAVASSSSSSATNQWADLSFVEVLEDLSSRFIVNLPNEELQRIERICFQVEQAHWFYEDFLRPLNASLPSLNLRKFSIYILQTASLSIPLIRKYVSSDADKDANGTVRDWQTLGGATYGLEAAFDEFMKYKTRVPVCGAVLLSDDWKSCLLVKGWKSSAAWGFPKGKINQSETHRDCAVRETCEETGFDCSHLLKPDSPDWMELNVREQKMRLYIVPGVSKDTPFETQTRKEISKIAWFKLSDLPTWKQSQANGGGGLASANAGAKFYLVTPFIGKLKQWIRDNKKRFLQEQSQAASKNLNGMDAATAAAASSSGIPGGVGAAPETANLASTTMQKPAGQPLFADSTSAWPLGSTQSNSGYTAHARPAQAQPEHGEAAARSDPSALLAMLQGSLHVSDPVAAPDAALKAVPQGPTQAALPLDQHSQAQLQQLRILSSESPLPAPRAQKASGQTLKLLEMLSPNSPAADRVEQKQQPQASPSVDDDRARKREALLSQLLKGAPTTNGSNQEPQTIPPVPVPAGPPVTDRSSKEAALLSLLQGQPGNNAQVPPASTLGSLTHPPPAAMPVAASDVPQPGSRSPFVPPIAAASSGIPSPDKGRASLLAMLNAGPMSHHQPSQLPPHHLSPHPHYAGHGVGLDAPSAQSRSFENPAVNGFPLHLPTAMGAFDQHAAGPTTFNADYAHAVGSHHAGLAQGPLMPTQGPPANESSWGYPTLQSHAASPGHFNPHPASMSSPAHNSAGPVHYAASHAAASPMYSHASPVALTATHHPPPHHGYQPPPNFQQHAPTYLHTMPAPPAHDQGDAAYAAQGRPAIPSPAASGFASATGSGGPHQSNGNQSLLALLNGRSGPS